MAVNPIIAPIDRIGAASAPPSVRDAFELVEPSLTPTAPTPRTGDLLRTVRDRSIAAIALLLLVPVLLLIAACIRCTGGGPVLYRQERIGRGGRPFQIVKFRTMVDGAHGLRDAVADRNRCDAVLFKVADDPRVTPIGCVLRRLSLDELPQLWNVLRGDMSLVGPRPALPSEVEAYEPHVHRRHLVLPGLTGLWQVSGRSDLPWGRAVELDLHYVEHQSHLLDLKILLRTIPAVLTGRGAH